VAAFEEFCRASGVPKLTQQAADVALEEHLTNVLSYGFAPAAEKFVEVSMSVSGDSLTVEVVDKGKEFNPLEAPAVDTSLPLDQKEIGGLGVHLMRQFMDELSYAREGGRNVLRMKKRFPAT